MLEASIVTEDVLRLRLVMGLRIHGLLGEHLIADLSGQFRIEHHSLSRKIWALNHATRVIVVVDWPKVGLLTEEPVLLPVSRYSSVTLGDRTSDTEVWNTVLVASRRTRHRGEAQLRLGLLVDFLHLLRQGPVLLLRAVVCRVV